MRKAVVIIPTYDEQGNMVKIIPLLEEELFTKITSWRMAILIVDGNNFKPSPDGTQEAIKDLQKKYENLKMITGKSKGIGAAYIDGMNFAKDEMGAEVIFEFDGDGSHDFLKIPEFLHKIEDGTDFVLGTRYTSGGSIPKNWGWHRKLLSFGGNLFSRLVLGHKEVTDWTGGFRAIRCEILGKLLPQMENSKGYVFQMSLLHKAIHLGAKVAEVPFHFKDRTLGKSKMPLGTIKDSLKYVVLERMKEILGGNFGKFLVVGGTGFAINAIFYYIFVHSFNLALWLANLLANIFAIFSNFYWNNRWTFAEKQATNIKDYLIKMGQFYFTSFFGVFFIQTGAIAILEKLFGRGGAMIYLIIGTALLLIWNFTMYSKVIWRKK